MGWKCNLFLDFKKLASVQWNGIYHFMGKKLAILATSLEKCHNNVISKAENNSDNFITRQLSKEYFEQCFIYNMM